MPLKHVLLAVFVAMIWGFNFVVIKAGLDSFPPLLFSGMRFVVAAIPAVFFIGRCGNSWWLIIKVGVVLGILQFGFLFVGMYMGMPAGLSSLVLQSQVIFTAILSAYLLNDRPNQIQIVGLIIAASALVLLGMQQGSSATFMGFILVVAAGLAWGIYNIMLKQAGQINMVGLMIWQCLIPPIPLFIMSAIFEHGQKNQLLQIGWSGIAVLLYTGLLSTVFAYVAWGWLIKKNTANKVAPFAFLVPIFGITFSSFTLGEELKVEAIYASIAIIFGLSLIVFSKQIRFTRRNA